MSLKKVNKGIVYMLLASFIFSFMGASAKELGKHMGSIELVFFRNVFGVIIIGYSIYKSPLKQVGGKPLLLLFRGTIGFLSLLAYFYNLKNIPLGDAVALNKTAPIFVAFFAYIFLKEKLNIIAWISIFIAFVGIILITKPTGFSFDKYDILGIFSGIGAALAYTSIKELKNMYDTRAIVMSFMAVGTIGPIVLMIVANFVDYPKLDFMFDKFVMPTGISWFYIVILGVSATASQVLMTKAYSYAKAGIIGAISYSNLLFATILGVMLGDIFPDLMTLTGLVLIVFSGVMITIKGK